MKKCECGCGNNVGLGRFSASKRGLRAHPAEYKKRRFLPGHNSRKTGGFGRGTRPYTLPVAFINVSPDKNENTEEKQNG